MSNPSNSSKSNLTQMHLSHLNLGKSYIISFYHPRQLYSTKRYHLWTTLSPFFCHHPHQLYSTKNIGIQAREMSGMELTSVSVLFITTLTGLLHCTHSDPDGFLSINCGAIDNQTDTKGLLWISDSPFIKSRNISTKHTETHHLQFWTVAYFTNLSAKKYCYLFPVKPGSNYLVRASFGPDHPLPLARFFDLLIEGIKWTKVDLSDVTNGYYRPHEIILAAKSESLSLCLARNSQTEKDHFVFISSIELRPLESSMYNSTDFQKNALNLIGDRIDFGASSESVQ